MRAAVGRTVDGALDRSVVLGYTTVGLWVRRRLADWPDDPAPRALRGRQVIVTGASSGLGIAAARQSAALGAEVVLLVRDQAKGERVAADIRTAVEGAALRVRRCDMADLDDVRRAGDALAAELDSLHAVVHNAGVMPPRRTTSEDGHELSMAVHVVGPLVLTERLRPSLAGGRVVFVTSGGMYAQRLRADDPAFLDGDYAPTAAYARSKRMQVELVPRLAERWGADGITVSAMHPGWADTPGVRESLPTFRALTRPLLRDADAGADTAVWLVAAEPSPPTGHLWHDRRRRPTDLVPWTRSSDAQRRAAWEWARDATGI